MSGLPRWLPENVCKWHDGLVEHLTDDFECALLQRLTSDLRMRTVWEWAGAAKPSISDTEPLDVRLQRDGISPRSLYNIVIDATQMPGYPGNLTPGQRAVYMKKVRDQAGALIALLEGTMWSHGDDQGYALSDDPTRPEDEFSIAVNLSEKHDTEYVIAYLATKNGVNRLPLDYPNSHLTDTLADLIEWTNQDDYFDRWRVKSSRLIKHYNLAAFFTRTVYATLRRFNFAIPFGVLADLANVTLELNPPLDEATVRKQIQRNKSNIETVNRDASRLNR